MRNLLKTTSPDIAARLDLDIADEAIGKWNSTKARANDRAKWDAVRALLRKAGLQVPEAATLRGYCADMRKRLKAAGTTDL